MPGPMVTIDVGRTAGTFTFTDGVADGRGETTVTGHGSFIVPDLQQLTPP